MENQKLSPIILDYQRDLNKTIVILHGDKKNPVLALTTEELANLYHQAQRSLKAAKGELKANAVDAVKGIKPTKTKEDKDTITISSKLYQNLNKVMVDNKKLNRLNEILLNENKHYKRLIISMLEKEH